MKPAKHNRQSSGMEQMFQFARPVDLLTVLVHLTLITTGAFIALLLTNLHEEKKKNEKEVVMLEQLHQNLIVDQQGLQSLVQYRTGLIRDSRAVKKFLVLQRPWNDSISNLIFHISGTNLFFPHIGTFESLKSTGIDLIQNPDIRFGLFSTYEENLKSLHATESNYAELLNHFWIPLISDHLMLDSSLAFLTPVDFESVKKNTRMLNMVSVIAIENDGFLTQTMHSLVDMSILLKQIEFELERIKSGNRNDIAPRKTKMVLKGYRDAKVVTVAGTFNQWEPNADSMVRSNNGWYLDLLLEPGWYMYRFTVDGVWIDDPGNTETVLNEFHSYNSFLKVE